MIRFTVRFSRKPPAAKSFASQSSSSGLVGGLVARKSSFGSTSPRPIRCSQTRFTCACAKNGLSGDATQSASAVRRSASGAERGRLRAEEHAASPAASCAGSSPRRRGSGRRSARRRTRACRGRPSACSPARGSRCGRRARRSRNTRRSSSGRTGGCGTSRSRRGCRGRPARPTRRAGAGRGRRARSSPAGSRRCCRVAERMSRANSFSGRSAASCAAIQR